MFSFLAPPMQFLLAKAVASACVLRRGQCSLILIVFAGLMFCSVGIAKASCIEDLRTVEFDSKNIVRLKSYACTAGERATDRIKVEFHRIADPLAGLIIEGRSSEMLTKAIGAPVLIENEVSRTYASLLKQYGQEQTSRGWLSFHLVAAGKGGTVGGYGGGLGDAPIDAGPFKILLPEDPAWTDSRYGNSLLGAHPYPAVDEIAALRKKVAPRQMHFFYATPCDDVEWEASLDFCKEPIMVFWRGMQAEDVSNYTKYLERLNRSVGEEAIAAEANSLDVPIELQLLNFIGGEGRWPEDFAIIVGASQVLGCGDVDEADYWEFWFFTRTILLDIATIQNTSDHPIVIDGLLGASSTEAKLRTESSFAARQKVPLGSASRSLAPGEKILVPLRISLARNYVFEHLFDSRKSLELYKRLGSKGLRGARYGVPQPKNYEFGRSLEITGVYVNGNRVDLRQRSANFIEVIMAVGGKSCPYLLAWDDADREWVDHGKILHDAKGKQRTETEIISFSGFQSKFRLEEREPELASIDEAELVVSLKNGETRTLKPEHARLTASDQDYIQLYWGEAIEIEFELPDGVAADDVLESHLHVTGFYQRYSELIPASASDDGPAQDDPLAEVKNVMNRETGPKPEMCPLPSLTALQPK